MQCNQLIPFSFESREVRVLLIDDEPWFCATDVCAVLDIVNVSRALCRLDEDEKGVHSMNTLGLLLKYYLPSARLVDMRLN